MCALYRRLFAQTFILQVVALVIQFTDALRKLQAVEFVALSSSYALATKLDVGECDTVAFDPAADHPSPHKEKVDEGMQTMELAVLEFSSECAHWLFEVDII